MPAAEERPRRLQGEEQPRAGGSSAQPEERSKTRAEVIARWKMPMRRRLVKRMLNVVKRLRRGARTAAGKSFGVHSNYEDEKNKLAKRGMFMSVNHPLRELAIRTIHTQAFYYFTLFAIVVSCVSLSLTSNSPKFQYTFRAKAIQMADYFVNAVFCGELVIKSIALGFVMEKGTYLRSGWNRMDMVVVVFGLLQYVPVLNRNGVVRAIRALRPLRLITRFQGLRDFASKCYKSVPDLANVVILTCFLFFLYGIIGLQLFMGVPEHNCAALMNPRPECIGCEAPFPSLADGLLPGDLPYLSNLTNFARYIGNSSGCPATCTLPEKPVWRIQQLGQTDLCSMPRVSDYPLRTLRDIETNGHRCRPGWWCIPASDPRFIYAKFDNIFWAWLTIFECVTLTNWSTFMYQLQDTLSQLVWIYFILLVVTCALFAVNLTVAVIFTHFQDESNEPQPSSSSDSDSSSNFDSDDDAFMARNRAAYGGQSGRDFLSGASSRSVMMSPDYESIASPRAPSAAAGMARRAQSVASTAASTGGSRPVAEGFNGGPGGSTQDLLWPHGRAHGDVGIGGPDACRALAPWGCDGAEGGSGGLGCSVEAEESWIVDRGAPPGECSGNGADVDDAATSAVAIGGCRSSRRAAATVKAVASSLEQPRRPPAGLRGDPSEPCSSESDGPARKNHGRSGRRGRRQAVLEGALGTDRRLSATAVGSNQSSGEMAAVRWSISTVAPPRTSAGAVSHSSSRAPKEARRKFNWLRKTSAMSSKLLLAFGARVVYSKTTEEVMVGVVLANTAIMCSEYYGMRSDVRAAFEKTNYAFTAIFTFEMLFKIAVEGWRVYFSTTWNRFDCVVVAASLIDIGIGASGHQSSSLNVLRSLRVIRMFRLARTWKRLGNLLQVVANSVKSLAYLAVILVLYLVIFALAGMQIFGYKSFTCVHTGVPKAVPLCPPGVPVMECPEVLHCFTPCTAAQNATWVTYANGFFGGPLDRMDSSGFPFFDGARYTLGGMCAEYRHPAAASAGAGGAAPGAFLVDLGLSYHAHGHFDDIFTSMMSVFRVLTFDNWTDMLFSSMESTAPAIALYYVALIFIGDYYLLSLFLSILLSNFGRENNKQQKAEKEARAESSVPEEKWRRRTKRISAVGIVGGIVRQAVTGARRAHVTGSRMLGSFRLDDPLSATSMIFPTDGPSVRGNDRSVVDTSLHHHAETHKSVHVPTTTDPEDRRGSLDLPAQRLLPHRELRTTEGGRQLPPAMSLDSHKASVFTRALLAKRVGPPSDDEGRPMMPGARSPRADRHKGDELPARPLTAGSSALRGGLSSRSANNNRSALQPPSSPSPRSNGGRNVVFAMSPADLDEAEERLARGDDSERLRQGSAIGRGQLSPGTGCSVNDNGNASSQQGAALRNQSLSGGGTGRSGGSPSSSMSRHSGLWEDLIKLAAELPGSRSAAHRVGSDRSAAPTAVGDGGQEPVSPVTGGTDSRRWDGLLAVAAASGLGTAAGDSGRGGASRRGGGSTQNPTESAAVGNSAFASSGPSPSQDGGAHADTVGSSENSGGAKAAASTLHQGRHVDFSSSSVVFEGGGQHPLVGTGFGESAEALQPRTPAGTENSNNPYSILNLPPHLRNTSTSTDNSIQPQSKASTDWQDRAPLSTGGLDGHGSGSGVSMGQRSAPRPKPLSLVLQAHGPSGATAPRKLSTVIDDPAAQEQAERAERAYEHLRRMESLRSQQVSQRVLQLASTLKSTVAHAALNVSVSFRGELPMGTSIRGRSVAAAQKGPALPRTGPSLKGVLSSMRGGAASLRGQVAPLPSALHASVHGPSFHGMSGQTSQGLYAHMPLQTGHSTAAARAGSAVSIGNNRNGSTDGPQGSEGSRGVSKRGQQHGGVYSNLPHGKSVEFSDPVFPLRLLDDESDASDAHGGSHHPPHSPHTTGTTIAGRGTSVAHCQSTSTVFGRDSLTLRGAETVGQKNLLLFGSSNALRVYADRVLRHQHFDWFVTACIAISAICTALDKPRLDPAGPTKRTLERVEFVFVAVFCFEALLKMVTMGLVLHKGAYLRSRWGAFEAAVALSGLLDVVLPRSNQSAILVVGRTLRVLRVMRLANRIRNLRVVTEALTTSTSGYINVLIVAVLTYLGFGILGVNLYLGKLWYCEDQFGNMMDPRHYGGVKITRSWCGDNGGTHWLMCPNGSPQLFPGAATAAGAARDGWACARTAAPAVLDNARTGLIETFGASFTCVPDGASTGIYNASVVSLCPPVVYTHRWRNPDFCNFDNIGWATLCLFEMASQESWTDVQYALSFAVAEDAQPLRDYNIYNMFFAFLYMICGSFFLINLFVGVTIDRYERLKEKADFKSLLTGHDHEQWFHVRKMVFGAAPRRLERVPQGFPRRLAHKLVKSGPFDKFILLCVVANVGILAAQHKGMNETWRFVLSSLNDAFTFIFVAEALLKIAAQGARAYVSDAWNAFDLGVALLSLAGTVLGYLAETRGVALLNVLRVLRIFRLIPRHPGLLTLFKTLLSSVPALGNVLSILLLFNFVYAVVGMRLFGRVVENRALNRHVNFYDFPTSMLVLARMSTGENWNSIMHATMVLDKCAKVVDPLSPLFGEWVGVSDLQTGLVHPRSVEDQCAPFHTRSCSIVYFCSFMLICSYLLINLIIGVIINYFQLNKGFECQTVSEEHVRLFVEAWGTLDEEATHFIDATRLDDLLAMVPEPLGTKGIGLNRRKTALLIAWGARIPMQEQLGLPRLHFTDTLYQLSARMAMPSTDLPPEAEEQLMSEFKNRVSSFDKHLKHHSGHSSAAIWAQSAIRGFLSRRALEHTNGERPKVHAGKIVGCVVVGPDGKPRRPASDAGISLADPRSSPTDCAPSRPLEAATASLRVEWPERPSQRSPAAANSHTERLMSFGGGDFDQGSRRVIASGSLADGPSSLHQSDGSAPGAPRGWGSKLSIISQPAGSGNFFAVATPSNESGSGLPRVHTAVSAAPSSRATGAGSSLGLLREAEALPPGVPNRETAEGSLAPMRSPGAGNSPLGTNSPAAITPSAAHSVRPASAGGAGPRCIIEEDVLPQFKCRQSESVRAQRSSDEEGPEGGEETREGAPPAAMSTHSRAAVGASLPPDSLVLHSNPLMALPADNRPMSSRPDRAGWHVNFAYSESRESDAH